jgi:hypothetical protein
VSGRCPLQRAAAVGSGPGCAHGSLLDSLLLLGMSVLRDVVRLGMGVREAGMAVGQGAPWIEVLWCGHLRRGWWAPAWSGAAGEEEVGAAAPVMHGLASLTAWRAACMMLAMVVAVSCG